MKYKLTDNTQEIDGTMLHQIEALKDFGDVKVGDLCGWLFNPWIICFKTVYVGYLVQLEYLVSLRYRDDITRLT